MPDNLLSNTLHFPILETERLLLREWEASDGEALLAIYCDEDVVRYTPIIALTSIEVAQDKIERFRSGFREKQDSIVWAVVSKESGKIIGESSVHSFAPEHRRLELGCSFSKDIWGKGIATESVAKVIEFTFSDFPTFEVNRIEACTDPRNLASMKVLEKLGFTNEGCLRQREIEKGEYVDSVFFGLLRSEYKK